MVPNSRTTQYKTMKWKLWRSRKYAKEEVLPQDEAYKSLDSSLKNDVSILVRARCETTLNSKGRLRYQEIAREAVTQVMTELAAEQQLQEQKHLEEQRQHFQEQHRRHGPTVFDVVDNKDDVEGFPVPSDFIEAIQGLNREALAVSKLLQDSYILATSDKVHLDKAMEAMDYAKAELNQMHGH